MSLKKAHSFPILLIILLLPSSLPLPNPQKHLKKTIQIPHGDTIDCFDLHHQPSLLHPLLKSHKIQIPAWLSSEEKRKRKEEKNGRRVKQGWNAIGGCPKGTVAIMRERESYVMHQSVHPHPLLSTAYNYNNEDEGGDTDDAPFEYAVAIAAEGEYNGGKATINVWNPNVERREELSAAQLWLLTHTEHITAGWQVNPSLYGDNKTRLTVGWMSSLNSEINGCYNHGCAGFVQLSHTIALGASIEPLSTSGDTNQQMDITIQIWMEEGLDGKYWCVSFGSEVVGYLPASLLFSEMREGRADVVIWGGIVLNMGGGDGEHHTSTEMGNGEFPIKGFGNSAYFQNISIVDGSNALQCPHHISTHISNPLCYDVFTPSHTCDMFYHGGPGNSAICP